MNTWTVVFRASNPYVDLIWSHLSWCTWAVSAFLDSRPLTLFIRWLPELLRLHSPLKNRFSPVPVRILRSNAKSTTVTKSDFWLPFLSASELLLLLTLFASRASLILGLPLYLHSQHSNIRKKKRTFFVPLNFPSGHTYEYLIWFKLL